MNPGSFDAMQAGCLCDGPVNGYGRGLDVSSYVSPSFDIAPNCPVHPAGWSPDLSAQITATPLPTSPRRVRVCSRCGEPAQLRLDATVCASCRIAKTDEAKAAAKKRGAA